MGAFDLGPFDNDAALDVVDELLETEAPSALIRTAVRGLSSAGACDDDSVFAAWAACELVAMAVSEGTGYDPDSNEYEAAARLRPTKALIKSCLQALPLLLSDESELTPLLDVAQRKSVAARLQATQSKLEAALLLEKIPRLKVPKFKAMEIFSVASAGKAMVLVRAMANTMVLDHVFDAPVPAVEEIDLDHIRVLANAWCHPQAEHFDSIGRVRIPDGPLVHNTYVSSIRFGCSSGGAEGGFDAAYFLHKGGSFAAATYDAVRALPFQQDWTSEQLRNALVTFMQTGVFAIAPVPSPEDLREEHLATCRSEWQAQLRGTGAGPFSFPRLYCVSPRATDDLVGPAMLVAWVKNRFGKNWSVGRFCMATDLMRFFLSGAIAAAAGVLGEDEVPRELHEHVMLLRDHLTASDFENARATALALRDPGGAIPRMLEAEPARREAFFRSVRRLEEALAPLAPPA